MWAEWIGCSRRDGSRWTKCERTWAEAPRRREAEVGIRPDWLGKRKKMQIDWRRRGSIHGIGEQPRLDRSRAPPARIPGTGCRPPSLFPSLFPSLLVLNPRPRQIRCGPRQIRCGGKYWRGDSPARATLADSRTRTSLSRAPFSPAVPRASFAKSSRGARLAAIGRQGNNGRRHMHTIPGALDATNFSPPGRQGDD